MARPAGGVTLRPCSNSRRWLIFIWGTLFVLHGRCVRPKLLCFGFLGCARLVWQMFQPVAPEIVLSVPTHTSQPFSFVFLPALESPATHPRPSIYWVELSFFVSVSWFTLCFVLLNFMCTNLHEWATTLVVKIVHVVMGWRFLRWKQNPKACICLCAEKKSRLVSD